MDGPFRKIWLGVQFDRLFASTRNVKTSYLQRIKGIWRVRIVVPRHLVRIIGKANLTHPLGTRDKQKAEKDARKKIDKFLTQIEDAERQLRGEPETWWTEYNYGPSNNFGTTRIRKGKPPPDMIPVIHDGDIRGYRYPSWPMPARQLEEVTSRVVQFESLVVLWVSHRGSTTPKARQAMVGKINRLVAFLGHSDAARVKPKDLAAFLRTLLASGLKPNTVDDHVAYLRRIFAVAKEAEWIAINPAEHLRHRERTGKVSRGATASGSRRTAARPA
jgi:hypothetical protein